MFIGYIRVNIFIPYSRSLKDKRRIIKRVKERVKYSFNVSVAEKPSDKWQICELCFVCVNYTKKCVNEIMQRIEEFIALSNDIHILDTEKDIV